jgi:drug/metabolite transporter (DMT)-like permease
VGVTETPRPLVGIVLILSAMAILPGIDVIAKMLGQQGMPITQIVWARMFFGAALTLPFALRQAGARALLPQRPVFHTVRAGFLMLATFCFFSSLKFLPIADALAIFFVQPLVLTALSPFLLGEKVGARRWAAVAVGFVGTLIIIRPGLGGINPGSLLALGAGTSLALYFLMTRRIAGSAPALVTTFHTMLIGTVVASGLAATVWVWPEDGQWLLFVALGLIAALGHYLITRAYDFAEASLLAPLAYTEMITSVALGWWFFGDFPDFWTFVGVAILISCAIYISVRERRAAD